MTDTNTIDRPKNSDWIDSLSNDDQIRLLYMTMESLRGSWRKPMRRAKMVQYLAGEIDADAVTIDLERVKRTAESFIARAIDPERHQDGRAFRRYYQAMDVDLDPETAERLAFHIPDDLSWDALRIARLEDDADGGADDDE